MKITIEIPEEFERDFEKVSYLTQANTQFEDSLMRIKTDILSNHLLSGMYEIEILDMLINAFKVKED